MKLWGETNEQYFTRLYRAYCETMHPLVASIEAQKQVKVREMSEQGEHPSLFDQPEHELTNVREGDKRIVIRDANMRQLIEDYLDIHIARFGRMSEFDAYEIVLRNGHSVIITAQALTEFENCPNRK